MAGISAAAKEYMRVAFIMAGIPSSLIDEAATINASSNLSLGATSHDAAAVTLIDTLRVSVGFPALGSTVVTDLLNKARLYGTNEGAPLPTPTLYPPATVQTSTNYLKNV